MAKNIYDHLEGLTGQRANIDFDKLAEAYSTAITERRDQDEQKQLDYYQKRSSNELHSDWLKRKLSKNIEEEIDNVDGSFPMISVFDAYQAVKEAARKHPRDMGIKRLETHLNKKWESNRTANLTVSDILNMKNHYAKSFPRSKAAKVMDDVSQRGYATLPVGKLTQISSCIRSQEDYDYHIRNAGLAGNNPYQKKARNFILALVNGEMERQAQLDPRMVDEQSKQMWEQEGPFGDPNALVNEFEQYKDMTTAPIPGDRQEGALDPNEVDEQSKQMWEQEGPFSDPNALVDQYEQDMSLVRQFEQDRQQGAGEDPAEFGDSGEQGRIQEMLKDYKERARAAEASGVKVEIDPMLPSISITDATNPDWGYHFQEHEADAMLEDIKEDIELFDGQLSAEELLLAQVMNW